MGQARRSIRRPSRGILTCLLVLLSAYPATAADADEVSREVAAALKAGSAGRLAAVLPERGRIRIELSTLSAEASGLFSASQGRYLFEDLFARWRIADFSLPDRSSQEPEDRAVYEGRLTASRHDESPLALDLRLVLVLEDGSWVLREIGERGRRAP